MYNKGDIKIEELRKEASEWLKKNPGEFAFRSCWECNPAHDHLKKADYVINCFDCGHWFWRGKDISITKKKQNN